MRYGSGWRRLVRLVTFDNQVQRDRRHRFTCMAGDAGSAAVRCSRRQLSLRSPPRRAPAGGRRTAGRLVTMINVILRSGCTTDRVIGVM